MNDAQNRIVHNYHYRDMYKSPINLSEARKTTTKSCTSEGNSPAAGDSGGLSWRVAYKKRCLEETKKSRQKLLSKFRHLQVYFFLPNISQSLNRI